MILKYFDINIFSFFENYKGRIATERSNLLICSLDKVIFLDLVWIFQ